MFWEEKPDDEVVADLKFLVEKDRFDEVVTHPLCFQEIRQNSEVLLNYLTQGANLKRLLDNSIFRVPDPNVDPVDQFKSSPFSISILSMASPIINQALMDDADLWPLIRDYLKDSDRKPYINHVTVGFYKRLMLNLVVGTSEFDLTLYEHLDQSGFVDDMIQNMKYGAVAELMVRFPMHGVCEVVQGAIFKMYVKHELPLKLMRLLNRETSDDVLENLVFVFSELDEMQLKNCFSAQPFSDLLFGSEALAILMEAAFPQDLGSFCPRVTIAACVMLLMFLDLNHSPDEPAFMINPELYMKEPQDEVYHGACELETMIAIKANDIMNCLLYCLETNDDDCIQAEISCVAVLQGLVNSRFFSTHDALRKVLSKEETSWRKLIEVIHAHPEASVLTTRIVNLFGYMLFSNPNMESFPLVDLILGYEGLYQMIPEKINSFPPKDKLTFSQRCELAAFVQLGLHLKEAENNETLVGRYVSMLVGDTNSAAAWNELSNTTLKSFIDNTQSGNIANTTDRSVVVDELEGNRDNEEFSLVDLSSTKERSFNVIEREIKWPETHVINFDGPRSDDREYCENYWADMDAGGFKRGFCGDTSTKRDDDDKEAVEEVLGELKEELNKIADAGDEWGDDSAIADDFPPICNSPHAKEVVQENRIDNKTEKFESPGVVLERLDSGKRTPTSSRFNPAFSSPPSSRFEPDASETPKTTRNANRDAYVVTADDSLFPEFTDDSRENSKSLLDASDDWSISLHVSPKEEADQGEEPPTSSSSTSNTKTDAQISQPDDWPTSPVTSAPNNAWPTSPDHSSPSQSTGWAKF
ncbi:unnamed protein product [Bursaphelenchus xylophilus]|uniref:(pine wood nematode) hypothetical protein n=1 Tax=Bursaphelenchus xylophilus TaxID=6326 RepID=A0A1I7SWL6_BURXY|nr:unnamed protein product [Bursaphelenchus xylophilus]CAG9099631.1 unnamed protein product [Bursaphelenchus xylophilus]